MARWCGLLVSRMQGSHGCISVQIAVIGKPADATHDCTELTCKAFPLTHGCISVQIAVIGEPADLTYEYTHLGASAKDIAPAKTSAFVKAMKQAQHPVVVVGPGVLKRDDGKAVMREVFDLVTAAGARLPGATDRCCLEPGSPAAPSARPRHHSAHARRMVSQRKDVITKHQCTPHQRYVNTD